LYLADFEFVGHDEEEGEGGDSAFVFGVVGSELLEVCSLSALFDVVFSKFAADLFEIFQAVYELFFM
jgi:hypothetical protein